MASVAEVKAAIDAVVAQVGEVQAAVQAASEQLAQAQQGLAAAVEGSEHEAVNRSQTALHQAGTELEGALTAMMSAAEQAQNYLATL